MSAFKVAIKTALIAQHLQIRMLAFPVMMVFILVAHNVYLAQALARHAS